MPGFVTDIADGVGPGRIAAISADARPDVHRDDVAVLQNSLARDAVNDFLVHGRANTSLEAEMAEEKRLGACFLQCVPGDVVEVPGGNPGRYRRLDASMDECDGLAGLPHQSDLALIFDRDCHVYYCLVEATRASTIARISAWTSSMDLRPSTVSSKPRLR